MFLRHYSTVVAQQSTTRPLVLVLGWLGCEDRYLAKYSKIYQDFGATVISLQPSLLATALPSAGHRSAFKFLQAVAERAEMAGNGQNNHHHHTNTFVHCMSNAGYLSFATMLSQLNSLQHENNPRHLQIVDLFRRKFIEQLRGVIIDSAPSHTTPKIWARGCVSAIFRTSVDAIEEDHPVLLAAAHKVAEQYITLPSISRHLREVRGAWSHYLHPNVPQMYLYSTADALIPASHVEQFIEQQQARGVAVTQHCWSDSGHCEHFRVHPKQYARLIHSFLERCCSSDVVV